MEGKDMLVNLTMLPKYESNAGENVKIKRACACEKAQILAFIREHFNEGWAGEAECAILQSPGKCFIATENGKLLGFSCYDATAKGFFGPIGVSEDARGKQVGSRLLFRTLEAMREFGYGYAIIGWVGDAAPFYEKTIGAKYIENGEPENSVYSNMIWM